MWNSISTRKKICTWCSRKETNYSRLNCSEGNQQIWRIKRSIMMPCCTSQELVTGCDLPPTVESCSEVHTSTISVCRSHVDCLDPTRFHQVHIRYIILEPQTKTMDVCCYLCCCIKQQAGLQTPSGLSNSSKDATGVFSVIQIDNDVVGTENCEDSFDTRSRESSQKQKNTF